MDLPYIDSLYDSLCKDVGNGVNEKNKTSPFLAYLPPIKSLPQYKNKKWKDSEFGVNGDETKDIYELYDFLNETEVINKVLPYTDYQEIVNWAYESSEALIKYNNSFLGIFDGFKQQFDNSEDMQNELKGILEEIKNSPEVKDILNLYQSENLAN